MTVVFGAGIRVAGGYWFLVRASARGVPVEVAVWVITILPLLLGGLAVAVALRVPRDRMLVASAAWPALIGTRPSR